MTFDCQSCGACCQASKDYTGEQYIRLTAEDVNQFTLEQQRLHTVAVDNDPYGMVGALCLNKGVCSALEGTIGEAVSCSVYSNRPSICRTFDMGGDCCRLAREEAGLSEWDNVTA